MLMRVVLKSEGSSAKTRTAPPPLAQLQLGRTYELAVRAAYQDFVAHWKDADPDIPIPRQAKAEYAKLK